MPPLANTSTVPVSAGTVEFAESFAWDFPVDVDAVQSLKDWCDTPMTALDNAIVDATTARGQVEHQRARLVETVVEHLTNMISASEHAVSCFRSLHSALEDYAGAMQPIRTEFQAIITDAAAAGLTVSQAGTQVTISHPADVPGGVGVIFASLRERCSINQKKFAYAESLFGDDLAGIDPTVWESTILAAFNRFVDTYRFPTGLNAASRYPSWADGLRNTAGDTTEAIYLQAKGAKFRHLLGSKMHPYGSKSPSTETSRTGRFPPSMPSKAAAEPSKPQTLFAWAAKSQAARVRSSMESSAPTTATSRTPTTTPRWERAKR